MRFLFLLIFLVSCGTFEGSNGLDGNNCITETKENHAIIQCDGQDPIVIENGKDGINGENGTNGKDGFDATIPEVPEFKGYWVLPNGGYLELLTTSDNRVYIYGTQRIYSVNYDGGLALHPNISAGPHYIRSGKVVGEYNANYSSSTNDVERDGSTSNITGIRRTVYIIEVLSDGRLQLTLTVYSTTGLGVDANRVITFR